MRKYYIFGSGQFAELVKDLLEDENKINKNRIFFISKKKINKRYYIDEKSFFLIKKKNKCLYCHR